MMLSCGTERVCGAGACMCRQRHAKVKVRTSRGDRCDDQQSSLDLAEVVAHTYAVLLAETIF